MIDERYAFGCARQAKAWEAINSHRMCVAIDKRACDSTKRSQTCRTWMFVHGPSNREILVGARFGKQQKCIHQRLFPNQISQDDQTCWNSQEDTTTTSKK
eukprot:675804-Amphidinium_carterae.1